MGTLARSTWTQLVVEVCSAVDAGRYGKLVRAEQFKVFVT